MRNDNNSDPSRLLGEFISYHLAQRNKNQLWLATNVGIARSQVSMLIRGNWRPTKRWVSRYVGTIAELLNCDRDQLGRLLEGVAVSDNTAHLSNRKRDHKSDRITPDIVKAVAEEVNPTQHVLKRLMKIEYILGSPLSYDTCKLLLRDVAQQHREPDV